MTEGSHRPNTIDGNVHPDRYPRHCNGFLLYYNWVVCDTMYLRHHFQWTILKAMPQAANIVSSNPLNRYSVDI